MLALLDILLLIFHILIIGFNLTGWIWKRTRRLHLWVIGITTLSWFVLGIWYGWGYCFLTDWHWNIKYQLGERNLPNSFIQYLFDGLGLSVHPDTTDAITLAGFIFAIGMGIYFNFIKNK